MISRDIKISASIRGATRLADENNDLSALISLLTACSLISKSLLQDNCVLYVLRHIETFKNNVL